MVNECMAKKARTHNGGKTVSPVSGAGKTGQLRLKNDIKTEVTWHACSRHTCVTITTTGLLKASKILGAEV